MNVRRLRRLAPIAVLAAALPLALLSAKGEMAGSPGSAGAGCGGAACHGLLPASDVQPAIEGLPEAYTPGETYVLTVRVGGGRAPLPPALASGGFALHASDGALAAPPGSEVVRVGDDGNATHTAEGAAAREWSVVWAAPPPTAGSVDFRVSVNAVNGNAIADPLDAWQTARFSSREGAIPPPPSPPTPDPASTTDEAAPDAATPGAGALALVAALAATARALRRRG